MLVRFRVSGLGFQEDLRFRVLGGAEGFGGQEEGCDPHAPKN